MPRTRRGSKPAEKSADAPTDSTAIVKAEVAGRVNSCGGTQGNPATDGARTTPDQVNLKSGLECIQKEEFASKIHSGEDIEKDEETNVEKMIEKLKMGSEEDKKTAALLEERRRQRVGGAGRGHGGSDAPPAEAKSVGKPPVIATTSVANMRAFLPKKLTNKPKKNAKAAATVNGNVSTASGTRKAP